MRYKVIERTTIVGIEHRDRTFYRFQPTVELRAGDVCRIDGTVGEVRRLKWWAKLLRLKFL